MTVLSPTGLERTSCRTCKAPVIWSQTAKKREPMPVDAEPVADGNVVLEKRWDKKQKEFYTAAVTYEPLIHAGQARYRSHFATCPDAAKWRKREASAVQVNCPVPGCQKAIAGRMLLCPKHWRLVPKVLQKAVWELYVPGQEADRSLVRPGYMKAMSEAVAAAEEADE
jgi:hypothetical protein